MRCGRAKGEWDWTYSTSHKLYSCRWGNRYCVTNDRLAGQNCCSATHFTGPWCMRCLVFAHGVRGSYSFLIAQFFIIVLFPMHFLSLPMCFLFSFFFWFSLFYYFFSVLLLCFCLIASCTVSLIFIFILFLFYLFYLCFIFYFSVALHSFWLLLVSWRATPSYKYKVKRNKRRGMKANVWRPNWKRRFQGGALSHRCCITTLVSIWRPSYSRNTGEKAFGVHRPFFLLSRNTKYGNKRGYT